MQAKDQSDDWVILLHGFLGSTTDMAELQTALEAQGYHTINRQYSSTSAGIADLADDIISTDLAEASGAKRINFVTHSMGGLLLRSYLERHEIAGLYRVVMLAPPNHGSEVADEMANFEWYGELLGPASLELQTIQGEAEKNGDYDLGIIAGTASVNPISSQILPGPDDGAVSVEATMLKGMDDFITVPTSHGFITKNASAIQQTILFLERGSFNHEIPTTGFPISTENWLELKDFLQAEPLNERELDP